MPESMGIPARREQAMNSNEPKHLPLALFFLRLSVFVVFLVWTIDKFVRPSHAEMVYQKFYFFPAFPAAAFYLLAVLELVLIFAFLLGIRKRLTYGAVLLFQFISTASCFAQYLAPFEEINILLYAGWPLLAACFALYVLRDHDKLLVWPEKEKRI